MLDDFANRLKSENKNVYLEIQGHTDATGPDDATTTGWASSAPKRSAAT